MKKVLFIFALILSVAVIGSLDSDRHDAAKLSQNDALVKTQLADYV